MMSRRLDYCLDFYMISRQINKNYLYFLISSLHTFWLEGFVKTQDCVNAVLLIFIGSGSAWLTRVTLEDIEKDKRNKKDQLHIIWKEKFQMIFN